MCRKSVWCVKNERCGKIDLTEEGVCVKSECMKIDCECEEKCV